MKTLTVKTPAPTAHNTTEDMIRAAYGMLNDKVALRISLVAAGQPTDLVDAGILRMIAHLSNLGISERTVRADMNEMRRQAEGKC